MQPRVRLETADPDLGLTIILWLADLLQAYGSSGNGRVVVTDETLIGRPSRRGPPRCPPGAVGRASPRRAGAVAPRAGR